MATVFYLVTITLFIEAINKREGEKSGHGRGA
jgi:hypothetical protein